jgi:hypothetical protein
MVLAALDVLVALQSLATAGRAACRPGLRGRARALPPRRHQSS